MKEVKLKLATIAEAKEFVSKAMKCDFDIDIFYNSVVIDGKSILGVLSLDLRRELTARLYGEDLEFETYLNSIATGSERVA